MADIDDILNERGAWYGDFAGVADISQAIKAAMRNSRNWDDLSNDKKEALEMLANKLGRILNGEPEYFDSWQDCIGYLTLVKGVLDG
jgi:hypothetical protein